MEVNLDRKNSSFLFEALGRTGNSVFIDNKSEKYVQGCSPMELVLMAVGSCSAIDIISILNKQKQVIDDYKIKVQGKRVKIKEAQPFEKIHVGIYLKGNIDRKRALRAADLSFNKYCSVSITLAKSVEVDYNIYLNEEKIK